MCNFKVIKRCITGFEAKIQEAIFIKKFNPTLNRQLHSSVSFFLLNLYRQFVVFPWRLFIYCLLFLQYFGLLHKQSASITIVQTINFLFNIIAICYYYSFLTMCIYFLFFLLWTTVQYCDRIIIFYATDTFIVTLLQFFLDFMIIFKM